MSRENELVLGVDLDGVCAQFYEKIRRVAAEWLGVDEETLTPEVSFGFEEWGLDPDDYQRMHRFAVVHHDLFSIIEPMPGAPAALRRLSRADIRIRIITHRLFIKHIHAITINQTIDWLDRYGIPYWDICFMIDKAEVGAHVYVEDAPHNIHNLRRLGKHVIVFENSTNLDLRGPRAKNWADVERLVQAHAREHGFEFTPYRVPG
ncbi:MAG: hypothetical protein MAG453_01611 [Calditrichaeota bacterium]|nr:hypothetical protein [Calditrichota bacterium]